MYVISNKLAFIAHPRTASRTIRGAIVARGGHQVGRRHEIDHELVGKMWLNRNIVACVQRNIFDVLVSWYHNYPGIRTKDFSEWLLTTDNEYLECAPYHYGLDLADFVIRFEHLQEDFDLLMDTINEPRMVLPMIGHTGHRCYRDYYTPDLRKYVEERWARDLEMTGYEY